MNKVAFEHALKNIADRTAEIAKADAQIRANNLREIARRKATPAPRSTPTESLTAGADGEGLASIRGKRQAYADAAAESEARWLGMVPVEVVVNNPDACPLDDCPMPADSRIYRHRRATNIIPPDHDCVRCAEGKTFEHRGTVRTVFSGSMCASAQRAVQLTRASGLHRLCTDCVLLERWMMEGTWCSTSACEMQHEFAQAVIHDANRTAYTELQHWTPGSVTTDEQGNPLSGGGGSVYVFGTPGSGKTYLLQCMTRMLCRQGYRTLFARVADFMREIKSSYDRENKTREEEIILRYSTVPILVWDDFGKEIGDPSWAGNLIWSVLDTRGKRNLPVIISSNYNLRAACMRFNPPQSAGAVNRGVNFGDSIHSRLAGMVQDHIYPLGGVDRRIR